MGTSIRDAVLGLQREYACLPGLRLSAPQVQRLFSLDALRCEAVLDALLHAGVLDRTSDGFFVRRAPSGSRRISGRRAPRSAAA